jgi:hypothetical protein
LLSIKSAFGWLTSAQGQFDKALDIFNEVLKLAEKKRPVFKAAGHDGIGNIILSW